MKLLALLFISFHLFASCSTVKVPRIVSIDTLRIINDENNVLSLESTVSIENTNHIDISGNELKFNVFYKNSNLGIGICDEKFNLKSKVITQVGISFQLYLDSIPEELRLKLFEMDSIPLTMQISFQGILGINHSKDGEFYLKMKDLQSALISSYLSDSGFELKDLKLESTNMNTTKFAGNLVLDNKLPLTLTLKKSEVFIFNLRKGGMKIGNFDIDENLKLNKDTTAYIPVQITIDNMKAASTSLDKVLAGTLDYFAIGNVLVSFHDKDFKIPIDIHFVYYPLSSKVKILEE